ncbi:MAG: low molecular weight protein-tyrosine-phosphatase [Solirubrobacteraceae bacterium]
MGGRGQQARAPGTVGGPGATRILFVCLGNICRSPTAEGVMRSLVAEAGLVERIELDSAGTGRWHVGSPPDRRAVAAARSRGIALGGHARQVSPGDFEAFDLLLAMDRANMRDLVQLAPGKPWREKIRLLREFDPQSAGDRDLEVPDPYYGAPGGFEEVLDIVQTACAGLLARIRVGEPV